MKWLMLFSVYDDKSLTYSPPFCAETMGLAERIFHQLATDPQSHVNKYPGDFTLYQIGRLNVESGQVEDVTPNIHVCRATQVLGPQSIAREA